MILDRDLNGKYFYTSTGNASDNFLMLCNSNEGYENEGGGSTVYLREFDKDVNQNGTFWINIDVKGNITSCVYTRRTDGQNFEVSIQPSGKSAGELDPDFSRFIEEYVPLMTAEIEKENQMIMGEWPDEPAEDTAD